MSAQSGSRPNAVLLVLCISQLVFAIDVTIVAVANPTIGRAVGLNDSNLQWTISAYSLTFGGFLLLGGRVADLFDRRKLFVTGLAGFTVASVIAAAAQTSVELIGARAAQGLCAAAVSPCTLAILASTFADGPARRRAYGLWAATGSIGGAMGFLLGGLLTSGLGWRSIFLINAPVGTVAVLAALRWLPRATGSRSRPQLDVPGAVTITLASGLTIFGVTRAQAHGWTSATAWGPIAAGVVLGLVFVVIERRAAAPLLSMHLVRHRGAIAIPPLIVLAVLSTGSIYLTSIFLQDVLGHTPGEAGAAVLGLPAGFGLGANISARLVDRLGVPRQAALGFSLVGASCVWLARSPSHGSLPPSIIVGMFGVGLGLGITVLVLITTVTSGVETSDQGALAGVYGMSQQLGGAIGLAVLASIAASGGTAGSGGHTTRSILQQAHSIRSAYALTAAIAVTTAVFARLALPSRNRFTEQRSRVTPSHEHSPF